MSKSSIFQALLARYGSCLLAAASSSGSKGVWTCLSKGTKAIRELYEIAEVRQFFRELDAAFPFWFYFLSTFGESFLLVLTFCLCRVTKMGAGHAMINPGDLQQFIERHFGAMNYIFDRFQLADSLNGKVSAEIARYYEEGGRQ